jgi:hypothetical protein
VTQGNEKSEVQRAGRLSGGLKEFPQVSATFPIVHLENLIDPRLSRKQQHESQVENDGSCSDFRTQGL